MSALAAIHAIRPERLTRDRFEVISINTGPISGQGMPQPLAEAPSIDDAVAAGCLRTAHKGTFLVRHTDKLTGKVMHHFYVVKRKSKPARRFHDHQTRSIHDLYAEHLLTLDATALAALGGEE